jgi:hypothetical protein
MRDGRRSGAGRRPKNAIARASDFLISSSCLRQSLSPASQSFGVRGEGGKA